MKGHWAIGLLLPALLLAAACGDDDDDSSGGSVREADGSGAAVAPSGDDVKPPSTGSTSTTDEGAGGGGVPLYSQVERKVIVSGSMSLEAPDVAQAFSLAGRAARNAGGYVEESSLRTRPGDEGDEQPFATLSLRVPAAAYEDVLTSLRSIEGVEVLSEGATSQEVTEEYTDLESRLRNLERTEAQYLELLASATTIEDILTVTDRLDGVRAQVEQIQGRINLLDSLTEFATIDVSIAAIVPAGAETKPSGPGAVFAEAWDWSLEVASVAGVIGAYLLVIAAWLAVPAAVVGGGLLVARRRRQATAGPPAAA